MTLYSADIMSLAEPVNKPTKKGRKKAPVPKEPLPTPMPTPPHKKERTEKQIAAFAKAQETRRLKKEALVTQAANLVKAEAEKQAAESAAHIAKEAKKQAQKEARLKRKAESSLDKDVENEVAALTTEKPKPKRTKKVLEIEQGSNQETSGDQEPPAWFHKYVQGVKKEEANISKEKKPAKQIQGEAKEVAHKSWNDSFTRARIENEVDGHMDRMYQTMFGNRMK